VSHYQGRVDWLQVKAAGAGFGIAKATEGLSGVDDQFEANWAGMRSAGLRVRGAYHFGHPGSDAAEQARHFVSVVGGSLRAGEFAVLDIESNAEKRPPADVAQWSADFVQAVQTLLDVPAARVLVYTGAWFWDAASGAAGGRQLGRSFFAHPLWVSAYVPSDPKLPRGWSGWTFWQYTDKKKLAGLTVDCSKYRGTQQQLETAMGL
jgi:lysozyme